MRHLPEVVKTLAGLFGGAPGRGTGALAQNAAFGPRTELNQPITGQRGFAGASIPLDTLKALAAAHDAKLNDVVMALCSGMLRRYLARHGGVPKKPLIAAMPISLREAGNTEYTTQATMAVVNLNTHIADPVKRLVAIRDAAGAVKAVAKRAKGLMPTDFPTIGVPWVMHGLATLYGRSGLSKAMPPLANVVISNVPGPQVPLYAAGARMATYWPMSIVEHGMGLNITVLSYAGAMDFGFTTALNVVGDARELSAALMEALDELVKKTREPAGRDGVARSQPRRLEPPRRSRLSGRPGSRAVRAHQRHHVTDAASQGHEPGMARSWNAIASPAAVVHTNAVGLEVVDVRPGAAGAACDAQRGAHRPDLRHLKHERRLMAAAPHAIRT